MDLMLPDEAATTRAGAALARCLPDEMARRSLLLSLSGELGSGKTPLARGLLRAQGVDGTIRSPTFTLVEPYRTARGAVDHLDLYRIAADTRELEAIGYRELRAEPGLVIVEWPERAAAALGPPDVAATLELEATGRRLILGAGTPTGRQWLEALSRAALS
jgi:tRNA threonylcarbamoyladenosine biosynthesis protein TsaE